MAITPNTDFSPGQVFTAGQADRFPRGVMGLQTLTTAYDTTSPHTTFQNNGMTLTITEELGRIYRITAACFPYPSGGLQGVFFRAMRAGVSIKQFNFSPTVMDAGVSLPLFMTFVYTSVASGSATYTMQIAAATANTSVSDYGDATFRRQFWIEDIGAS
jgi:hypothetical protein